MTMKFHADEGRLEWREFISYRVSSSFFPPTTKTLNTYIYSITLSIFTIYRTHKICTNWRMEDSKIHSFWYEARQVFAISARSRKNWVETGVWHKPAEVCNWTLFSACRFDSSSLAENRSSYTIFFSFQKLQQRLRFNSLIFIGSQKFSLLLVRFKKLGSKSVDFFSTPS